MTQLEGTASMAGIPVPEGYRLVPILPTEDMMFAADKARALPEAFIREVWAAMVGVATGPLSAPDEEVVGQAARHAEHLETMADVIVGSGFAGQLESKGAMQRAARFIRSTEAERVALQAAHDSLMNEVTSFRSSFREQTSWKAQRAALCEIRQRWVDGYAFNEDSDEDAALKESTHADE